MSLAEEQIKFLKVENKSLKSLNKELVSEVKELRSISPVREKPEAEAKDLPESSAKKDLLVSSAAKFQIS